VGYSVGDPVSSKNSFRFTWVVIDSIPGKLLCVVDDDDVVVGVAAVINESSTYIDSDVRYERNILNDSTTTNAVNFKRKTWNKEATSKQEEVRDAG